MWRLDKNEWLLVFRNTERITKLCLPDLGSVHYILHITVGYAHGKGSPEDPCQRRDSSWHRRLAKISVGGEPAQGQSRVTGGSLCFLSAGSSATYPCLPGEQETILGRGLPMPGASAPVLSNFGGRRAKLLLEGLFFLVLLTELEAENTQSHMEMV